MTTLAQRAHAMLDAATMVERDAVDVFALARDHDAADLLALARLIGSTSRTAERIRARVVGAMRMRPIRDVGGDRPGWQDIADSLGESKATTYGRHERALREGVDVAFDNATDTQSAVAALTGAMTSHVLDGEVSTEQLIVAAQASWERRQFNSADGGIVLAALADRIGWDATAEQTGIPIDIARSWSAPPRGDRT